MFLSTLLLGVGLSLFAVDGPTVESSAIGFTSTLHIETPGGGSGSQQSVNVNHDWSLHDDTDTDDDDDPDGDDAPALVTVVFASDLQCGRTGDRLTTDTTVRPDVRSERP